MADEELIYPAEFIPDVDSVYFRAHREHMRDGMLGPGVFRAHGGGMSVDWDKYSSAELTRIRGRQNPDNYAVIRINVGAIRGIRDLDVRHTPQPENRAHSDVNLPEDGGDLTEVRVCLKRISTVVVPLGSLP